jgi:hypothetical protein
MLNFYDPRPIPTNRIHKYTFLHAMDELTYSGQKPTFILSLNTLKM